MNRRNVLIMGAAGRDFHDFNTIFRDSERYNVVAFTATQIPGIEERRYPPELAGRLYPEGIPIFPEARLKRFIEMRGADAGDRAHLIALPAFWVGLTYDQSALDAAFDLVKGWSAETREAWRIGASAISRLSCLSMSSPSFATRKSAPGRNSPSLSLHGAETSAIPDASASNTRIVGMPGSCLT